MISANIVAQIITVQQTTTQGAENQFQKPDKSHGCCGHKQDDFMSILEDVAAQQLDGLAANSPFFPGMQNDSQRFQSSSDSIDMFAGLLSNSSSNGSQDQFSFMQSLSIAQMRTFQPYEAGLTEGASFREVQGIMHRVAGLFDHHSEQNSQKSPPLFPPANAPQEVVDAWNQASSNASETDIMLVSGMFFSMALTESENQGGIAAIGEESQDIFSEESEQYWQQIDALLAMIDKSLEKSPEKTEAMEGAKELLTDFLDQLNETAEA
ncbi:MAG: hypothetical protein HQL70_06025 [Magnetococcales bacterium]|nr:hypothetical protein [Magnetococcales bacterium]